MQNAYISAIVRHNELGYGEIFHQIHGIAH